MVGNITDATAALDGTAEYLDEGCLRKAYLINGIVYKVCFSPNDDWFNENEPEAVNEVRAKNTRHDVVIPEVTSYVIGGRVVNAIEFVDGVFIGSCIGSELGKACDCAPYPCFTPEMRDYMESLYDDATSGGNVILSAGVYYLIDLA